MDEPWKVRLQNGCHFIPISSKNDPISQGMLQNVTQVLEMSQSIEKYRYAIQLLLFMHLP